ncbi:GIY-YIG nuclease family protein [Paracoccus shandongensis]|uniref:GIY-YIG nuclease family protein n=1 Tax=Paracoccus shandongensis TaxID=2816048 RepID=UPI001A8D9B65|nr:GIY-YIG nuclease family protein [Paracoccus shandongensis]
MAGGGVTGARKSRGSLKVRWFRRAVPWGTVYLTCDERYPQRIKIGFTQRKMTERRRELARGFEKRLLIVQTIQMPHAHCLESRCLKSATRLADRDFAKSSEWFVLGDGFTLDDVAQTMLDNARRLRREARWKLAWPSQGRVTVFDSGWRKDGLRPSEKYDLS